MDCYDKFCAIPVHKLDNSFRLFNNSDHQSEPLGICSFPIKKNYGVQLVIPHGIYAFGPEFFQTL